MISNTVLLIDFDGTIVPTNSKLIRIFDEITNLPASSQTRTKLMNSSFEEICRYILNKKGEDVLNNYCAHVAEIYRKTAPHKGLDTFLQKQVEKRRRVFVLSNNSKENIETYMEQNDLLHFFSGIIVPSNKKEEKPSVEMLKNFMKENRGCKLVVVDDNDKFVANAAKIGLTGSVFLCQAGEMCEDTFESHVEVPEESYVKYL